MDPDVHYTNSKNLEATFVKLSEKIKYFITEFIDVWQQFAESYCFVTKNSNIDDVTIFRHLAVELTFLYSLHHSLVCTTVVCVQSIRRSATYTECVQRIAMCANCAEHRCVRTTQKTQQNLQDTWMCSKF